MANPIYQILITLQGVKPTVWRRIQVDSGLKVSDFHNVLQTTMGWTNSHLHQFIKDSQYYSKKTPDVEFWEEGKDVDYKGLRVFDLLEKENDCIEYIYDFGDYWTHTILLEKILPENTVLKKPVCLDGARHCPHEDSGGSGGYMELLKIVKKPAHPEYEDYVTWLGKGFDPEKFDKKDVTELLSNKSFGVLTWEETMKQKLFGNGNESLENCEGLSSQEMNGLVMSPFGESSPLRLKPLLKEDLVNIPMIKLTKYLLDFIEREKELKLTPKGCLPEKVVSGMFSQGFVMNSFNKSWLGKAKRIREDDDLSFILTRSLLEASGLVKRRKGRLSLTKKGVKLKADDQLLFQYLLSFLIMDYDWLNMDAYGYDDIGSYGSAYSLILLGLYGNQKRLDNFYAEKYFKAFPWLREINEHFGFLPHTDYPSSCYSYRTFDVFANFLGLAEIEEIHMIKPVYCFEKHVKKTELFDKVFEIATLKLI